VKGKGTSPSNLTRLESINEIPTRDIGDSGNLFDRFGRKRGIFFDHFQRDFLQ
jgi:hypothetical protein